MDGNDERTSLLNHTTLETITDDKSNTNDGTKSYTESSGYTQSKSITESTGYTQSKSSTESTESDSSLSSVNLKDETDSTLSSSGSSESSSISASTANASNNRKQQDIPHYSAENSCSGSIELQSIPKFNKNRPLTNREKAIIQEQKDEISKQKAYTRICKFSWKNLSFLLCYSLISITGFFYPFNTFENLMQSELGIIPCNVSFILSCGTGCFFIAGGYYGIFYDRYGCSWGLYIGGIFAFIGNMCLSASFQHIITPDMLQLSLQSATVSSGYGMIYMTCLLVILKSAANRHRGKVNGFVQALWMMGAYTTPKLNSIIFTIVTGQDDSSEVNAKTEGEKVLFKAIWTSLFVALGAFLIKEEQSKWYFHIDYKYKPYFKAKYDKPFTMKQFKDLQFLCFMGMGSFMLCACYLYPSQISLILGSFSERSYASIYKRTISYLAAGSSLVTGIGIDLLKWNQRPAMFMFVSIFMMLIANGMLIFNMYNMLLTAASINAIAMGIFWGCYPLMMSDIYGLSNLGTNLGVSFVIGGLICGYLQTAAGESYAQTIEDNDIVCYGAPCFRNVFITNQFLICLSFVFLITLSHRRKQKSDLRRKGVLDVKYLDNGAEKDFLASRNLNKELFGQEPEEDVWHDNELIYGDDNGEKIFTGLMKDKTESLSPVEMKETIDHNASTEWSNDSEKILFSDEIVSKLFQDTPSSNETSRDGRTESIEPHPSTFNTESDTNTDTDKTGSKSKVVENEKGKKSQLSSTLHTSEISSDIDLEETDSTDSSTNTKIKTSEDNIENN